MSAYKTMQTQMRDIGILKIAMERCKPEWAGKIEVAEPGKPVNIHGDTSVQGELVIKKGKIGTYGDIGVVREKNGTLSVKVSDVDTGSYFHDAAKRAKEGKLYDQGFMDKLSQMYGLVEGVVEANKVGWSPVNGEVVALGQNQTAAGMTGKCSGIRVKISRELAMQLAAV